MREVLATDRMGHVHSVFASSCNLRLGDELVHLGSDDRYLSAFGLSLPAAIVRPLCQGIAPGDVVRCAAGSLAIYGSQAGFVRLDLAPMTDVDLRIPPVPIAAWLRPEAARLREMDDVAIGLERDARLAAWASALVNASLGSPDWEAAVNALIGRGLGLTPAGDDLLFGYLAALAAAGEASLSPRLTLRFAGRTTEISVAYASWLGRGVVSRHIQTLLRAVAVGTGIDRAITLLEQHGATSGRDTRFGISLALHRLERQSRELHA